jgi:hypothetical protein
VLAIGEAHRGGGEFAAALDHHLVRPVDHDLRDAVIGQQNLQRTEAADLVDDRVDELVEGADGQGHVVVGEDEVREAANVLAQRLTGHALEGAEIRLPQEAVVDLTLDAQHLRRVEDGRRL